MAQNKDPRRRSLSVEAGTVSMKLLTPGWTSPAEWCTQQEARLRGGTVCRRRAQCDTKPPCRSNHVYSYCMDSPLPRDFRCATYQAPDQSIHVSKLGGIWQGSTGKRGRIAYNRIPFVSLIYNSDPL